MRHSHYAAQISTTYSRHYSYTTDLTRKKTLTQTVLFYLINTLFFFCSATSHANENVLYPVAAIASSIERNDTNAISAIDKNINTRWSSAFSDSQWIYLDFGGPVNFTRLRIGWERAYAERYEVQTSPNGLNWTTIKTVTSGFGGKEEVIISGTGRFLRVNCLKRAGPYGYSIYELAAFGHALISTSSTLTPLRAVASGSERADINADKVIDKNHTTRWSSVFNDHQWIYLDFGKNVIFDRLVINWENAHATDYDIQTSNNGLQWASIKNIRGSLGGIEDLPLNGSGRFIRMNGIKRSTQYGYSIFEMTAYGKTSPSIQTVQAVTPSSPSSVLAPRTQTIALNTSNSSPKINLSTSTMTNLNTNTNQGATQPTAPRTNTTTLNPNTQNNPTTQPVANTTNTTSTAINNVNTPYIPLFSANIQPMELIQYREADGTLVTVAGFRPAENRHARESNAHGFLNFPALYFQNRNFGLIIRDGVPAGRQEIKIYGRVPKGKTLQGQDAVNMQWDWGISMFRDRGPNLRKYGWNNNMGLMKNLDPKYSNYVFDQTRPFTNGEVCASDNGPFDCPRREITQYEDNDILWDGSRGEGRRPLKLGDGIEISPANFLKNQGSGRPADIDGGGSRYYSWEQLYVVGRGIVPWYGAGPGLYSVPIPQDALSSGTASLNYQYAGQPHRMFQQVVNNIGFENLQRFTNGRRIFHTSFLNGTHTEHPDKNPPLLQYANQLGARFNSERCISCHNLNGRSLPANLGQPMHSFAILTALSSGNSGTTPDPIYGMNVQQQTRAGSDYSVFIQSYQTTIRTLPDGERIELQKPIYAFRGPTPLQYSVRQAPQVIGTGLLEAVTEASILALADPNDANGDGVRGIPNWSINPETGQRHVGRFGWKASKSSVRHQVGSALILDMGVVSPVYKSRECQRDFRASACKNATAMGGISEEDLQKITHYLQLLGVPSQVSYASSFKPDPDTGKDLPMTTEHNIDTTAIRQGADLFRRAQCTACHTPELKTGNTHPFMELRNQTIRPYSDLLLHDMGAGLADTLTEGNAQAAMWRTQPLWGLGTLPWTQIDEQTLAKEDQPEERYTPRQKPGAITKARYLHDGRARTLTEAILWHDGEATNSRRLFENMTRQERSALLAFLNSL